MPEYGSQIGKKFAKDGQALPYPGNTVISDVCPGNPAYDVMSACRSMLLDSPLASRCIPLPEIATLMEHQRAHLLPPGDHVLAPDGRVCTLRIDLVMEDKPLVIDLPGGATLTLTPDHHLTLTGLGEPITRTVPMTGTAAGMFLAVDESTIECMVCGAWLSARFYPEEAAPLVVHAPVFCEAVVCDSIASVNDLF